MILRAIVEEHCDQAGFLWSLRDAAAVAPHYDLDDLARLDERVEAHLDALLLSADVAWDLCKAALDLLEEPGSAFTATVVAVRRGDLRGIAAILDAVGRVPALEDAVGAGLGWVGFEQVAAILPGLLDPRCPPELVRLGIEASARHRVDPGQALDDALLADDRRLEARALRAMGELGRTNRSRELRARLASLDVACRFWAAWSLAIAGDLEALPVLWEHVERGGPHLAPACAVAFRQADLASATRLVRSLGAGADTSRTAVIGAGIVGDPGLVPWLLQHMDSPKLARVAGESFTRITGADLERERLRGKPPEGFEAGPNDDPADPNVALDPDENLPWPEIQAVARWWDQHKSRLSGGTRHLLGKPKTPPWLEQVLRGGGQRARAAAALELSIADAGRPIFDVSAPAVRQQKALGRG